MPDCLPLILLLLQVVLLWLIVPREGRPALVLMMTPAVLRQLQHCYCHLAWRRVQKLHMVPLAPLQLLPEVVTQVEPQQTSGRCHQGSCCLAALSWLLQMG